MVVLGRPASCGAPSGAGQAQLLSVRVGGTGRQPPGQGVAAGLVESELDLDTLRAALRIADDLPRFVRYCGCAGRAHFHVIRLADWGVVVKGTLFMRMFHRRTLQLSLSHQCDCRNTITVRYTFLISWGAVA